MIGDICSQEQAIKFNLESEREDRLRLQERIIELERQLAHLLQASQLCDKEETEATPASVLSEDGAPDHHPV